METIMALPNIVINMKKQWLLPAFLLAMAVIVVVNTLQKNASVDAQLAEEKNASIIVNAGIQEITAALDVCKMFSSAKASECSLDVGNFLQCVNGPLTALNYNTCLKDLRVELCNYYTNADNCKKEAQNWYESSKNVMPIAVPTGTGYQH